MERYAGRHLGGEILAASMNASDRIHQFLAHAAFQQIACRAGTKGAHGLGVSGIRGQDDDPR
jgi:hypothetical protein